jgi:hypothetical protein
MTIYEKAKAISLLQSVEEVLMSFNDTLERAIKKQKGEDSGSDKAVSR